MRNIRDGYRPNLEFRGGGEGRHLPTLGGQIKKNLRLLRLKMWPLFRFQKSAVETSILEQPKQYFRKRLAGPVHHCRSAHKSRLLSLHAKDQLKAAPTSASSFFCPRQKGYNNKQAPPVFELWFVLHLNSSLYAFCPLVAD
jgi:hypothetical protein